MATHLHCDAAETGEPEPWVYEQGVVDGHWYARRYGMVAAKYEAPRRTIMRQLGPYTTRAEAMRAHALAMLDGSML